MTHRHMRPLHRVDLVAHHSVCETNFHRLSALLPGLRAGISCWSFTAGLATSTFDIHVKVLDEAPYTTTLSVEQTHNHIETPKIVVRLYHDASMAEIVSWDNHRHWKPQYRYPNDQMYHPDEKMALNQFLSDWLTFCRNLGLQPANSVIQFT